MAHNTTPRLVVASDHRGGWSSPGDDPALRIAPDPPEDWTRSGRRAHLERWVSSVREVELDGERQVALTLWWPPHPYHGFVGPVTSLPSCSCELVGADRPTIIRASPVHAPPFIRTTIVLTRALLAAAHLHGHRGRLRVQWHIDGAVVVRDHLNARFDHP